MDGPDAKRYKKSDKAKRNYELRGGFSSKHIRISLQTQAKPKAVTEVAALKKK